MRASTLAVLVLAALLAVPACADEPPPKLEIDVVYQTAPTGGPFTLYVHDTEHEPCCLPEIRWPATVGACAERTDGFWCQECNTWRCVREIRVEQGGQVMLSLDVSDTTNGGEFGVVNTVIPGLPAELVFEGCGGTARVPLPTEIMTPPILTEVTRDQEGVAFSWTLPPAAASAVWGYGTGFAGRECQVATTTTSAGLAVGPTASFISIHVLALAAPVVHDTRLGTVRVWNVAAAGQAVPPP